MGHNQKMLEENNEKWGGKVRLIGLSIDNDSATVKNHVTTKGWTSVEHYHVRNGKCISDKDFGVRGVPHVAIVDTTGKIVFVGHPASRPDLAQDFNDLLEGKAITGQGTTAAGDGDDEDEEFKANCEPDKITECVEQFKKMSEEHLMTEATKTECEGMPRAFCVLVVSEKYNCKTNVLECNMTNYHVLVGSQEKIDKAKTILAPFNGQGWEVVVREQAR